MSGAERLAGAMVKGLYVWRANDGASVIDFLVGRDKGAAFRQTRAEYLDL